MRTMVIFKFAKPCFRSHTLVQELNIPYQRFCSSKKKGWILSQMSQTEEALSVLYQALNMFPLDHHFMSRSQIHSNIGLIYFEDNLEKANQHYNKALIYSKYGNVTDRMGLVSLNIALCSILSGENHVAEQKAFQEGSKQLKRIKTTVV